MGPCAFCGADDSPQIVGIFQLVRHDQEGRFAPLFCQREYVLHPGVFVGSRQGHYALVGRPGAKVIQLADVHFFHRDPLILGLCRYHPQCSGTAAPGQQDTVYRPAGAQRLQNGVAPCDDLFFPAVPVFCHTC